MSAQRPPLDEHLETLHAQAGFTLRALRSTGIQLERLLHRRQTSPAQIDQLRSQVRAAMRALRTTNQLLAQAAQLLDDPSEQPQEADHGRNRHGIPARLG